MKKSLNKANLRIDELVNIVSSNSNKDENINFVLNQNKTLEKTNSDISKKLKDSEEKYSIEIMRHKKFISLKEEELSNLKQVFENKTVRQKMKKIEFKSFISNLMNEIKNQKEIIRNLETNCTSHHYDIKSEISEINLEKDHNRNIENLKDVK